MSNSRSKKLFACFLTALGFSAMSVNNKVANAAFEKYKIDERVSLNTFVEGLKTGPGLQGTYINLLKSLKKILENRLNGNINSRLKNSMSQKKLSAELLKREIERVRSINSTNFCDIDNLKSVKNFIDQYVIDLRGGHYTVWSQDVINAVSNLSGCINKELGSIEDFKKNFKIENETKNKEVIIPDHVYEKINKILNSKLECTTFSTHGIECCITEVKDFNHFEECMHTNEENPKFQDGNLTASIMGLDDLDYMAEVISISEAFKSAKDFSITVKDNCYNVSFHNKQDKEYIIVFPKEDTYKKLRYLVRVPNENTFFVKES